MDEELEKSLKATDGESEYDKAVKRLLAHKNVIARILVTVVDEFKGMPLTEVMPLIEGDVLTQTVSVEPGLTNKSLQEKINGMNNENAEIDEGEVFFDLYFKVKMTSGLKNFIINIEAQRREPTNYDILNRATFYVARMISAQKTREFFRQDYNDILPVYSIWLVMHLDEPCTSIVRFQQQDLLGRHKWRGNLGLMNIAMVGIPEQLPSGQYELHRFLTGLLSNDFSVNEKKQILNEYDLGTDTKIVKEVEDMCNLSYDIKEQGIIQGRAEGLAEGREQGRAEGEALGREKTELKFALIMLRNNLKLDEIISSTGFDKAKLMNLAKENNIKYNFAV